jgi:hypothetical protein
MYANARELTLPWQQVRTNGTGTVRYTICLWRLTLAPSLVNDCLPVSMIWFACFDPSVPLCLIILIQTPKDLLILVDKYPA